MKNFLKSLVNSFLNTSCCVKVKFILFITVFLIFKIVIIKEIQSISLEMEKMIVLCNYWEVVHKSLVEPEKPLSNFNLEEYNSDLAKEYNRKIQFKIGEAKDNALKFKDFSSSTPVFQDCTLLTKEVYNSTFQNNLKNYDSIASYLRSIIFRANTTNGEFFDSKPKIDAIRFKSDDTFENFKKLGIDVPSNILKPKSWDDINAVTIFSGNRTFSEMHLCHSKYLWTKFFKELSEILKSDSIPHNTSFNIFYSVKNGFKFVYSILKFSINYNSDLNALLNSELIECSKKAIIRSYCFSKYHSTPIECFKIYWKHYSTENLDLIVNYKNRLTLLDKFNIYIRLPYFLGGGGLTAADYTKFLMENDFVKFPDITDWSKVGYIKDLNHLSNESIEVPETQFQNKGVDSMFFLPPYDCEEFRLLSYEEKIATIRNNRIISNRRKLIGNKVFLYLNETN